MAVRWTFGDRSLPTTLRFPFSSPRVAFLSLPHASLSFLFPTLRFPFSSPRVAFLSLPHASLSFLFQSRALGTVSSGLSTVTSGLWTVKVVVYGQQKQWFIDGKSSGLWTAKVVVYGHCLVTPPHIPPPPPPTTNIKNKNKNPTPLPVLCRNDSAGDSVQR